MEPADAVLTLRASLNSGVAQGQLYVGGTTAAVQLGVGECSRYASCNDCLVARDPHCGWDLLRGLCAAVAGASNSSM